MVVGGVDSRGTEAAAAGDSKGKGKAPSRGAQGPAGRGLLRDVLSGGGRVTGFGEGGPADERAGPPPRVGGDWRMDPTGPASGTRSARIGRWVAEEAAERFIPWVQTRPIAEWNNRLAEAVQA
eukprot:3769258-Rhodomonas_salina.1